MAEKKVVDLNVWDVGGYESDYEDKSVWRIDVYECYDDVDFEHHDLPFQRIWLTDTQAEMLTLGKSPDEDGDYTEDSDFWLDPAGFLDVYKNVPRKVRRYLEALV